MPDDPGMLDARSTGGALAPPLVESVLERLGLAARPTLDLAGSVLSISHGARACRRQRAQAGGAPHRTTGAAAGWRRHGFPDALARARDGGTCWPSSNALFALLESLGFPARRVAGSMRDMGVRNHGSVQGRARRSRLVVDSSMLTRSPLPLGLAFMSMPTRCCRWRSKPAEQGEEGSHVLWFDTAPTPGWLACGCWTTR
jgi:hypothetical protein